MVVAKEMKVVLGFEERLAVAFAVDYMFTNGSLGSLEWELENPADEDHTMIAENIKEGHDCGWHWQLTYKKYSSI